MTKKKSDILDNVTKRFIEVIASLEITPYRISQDIKSISESKLSHIKSGRNKVSLELIIEFCQFYDISLDWLIFGVNPKNISDKNISSLTSVILEQSKLMKELSDKIIIKKLN